MFSPDQALIWRYWLELITARHRFAQSYCRASAPLEQLMASGLGSVILYCTATAFKRSDFYGIQGFLIVPYRIFAPTLFPIFTVLRYCRILPYPR